LNVKNITYNNFSKEELDNLLNLSIAGDTDSLNKLSELIRNIAFSYFKIKYRSGKLPNIEDAEDLAHNVYISFAEQYKKIQNIEHWLRRVLFLVFVNWYKKQKKFPHFELDEAYRKSIEYIEHDISLDSAKVVEIMNNLSGNKRDIIQMRFWKELKFSEIAKKLDKSEDSVKKMLYRAIQEIKKNWNKMSLFLNLSTI